MYIGSVNGSFGATWPENTAHIKIADMQLFTKDLFWQSLESCDSMEKMTAFFGIVWVTNNNGVQTTATMVRLNGSVLEKRRLEEVFGLLHADHLMSSGFGYPPHFKIDLHNRSCIDSVVFVRRTGVPVVQKDAFGNPEAWTQNFEIQVSMSLSANSVNVWPTPGMTAGVQEFRIPMRPLLSLNPAWSSIEQKDAKINENTGETRSRATVPVLAWTESIREIMGTLSHAPSAPEFTEHSGGLMPHQVKNVLHMQQEEIHNLNEKIWLVFGSSMYYSPLLRQFFDARLPVVHGGFILDRVGTGKTRSTLGLVISGILDGSNRDLPTLVICNTTMASHWYQEAHQVALGMNLQRDPNVYMYYGPKRTKNLGVLSAQDIIITTASTLIAERGLENRLRDIQLRRVIVDESHTMSSNMSEMISNLNTNTRWLVTATPAPKIDIYLRQLRALGIMMDTSKHHFMSVIGSSMGALRHLFQETSSRFEGDATSERSHVHYVQMDAETKNKYETLKTNTRDEIYLYRNNGAQASRKFWILRARLSSSNFDEIELCHMPQMHSDPQSFAAAIASQECPICLSTLENPTVTPCNHIFCMRCIQRQVSIGRHTCPNCRQNIAWSNLRLLEASVVDQEPANNQNPKVNDIFGTILNSTCAKFVVFSEFSSTRSLLRQILNENNIAVYEILGHMTQCRRDKEIKNFTNDTQKCVFMLNTKTSSVGLNLQAASSVIFCEPLANKDIYKQCMGRINRIGQTSEVLDIHTFIIAETIEENIHRKVERENSWSPNVHTILNLLA